MEPPRTCCGQSIFGLYVRQPLMGTIQDRTNVGNNRQCRWDTCRPDFEAMCQHLVQNQFTSDAFQGDSDYLFQWDTNVWESWPDVDGQNFKEDWDKEGHINHSKRSETVLTTEDIHQLQQDTPAHNELRAPMNQFMERQFANQEPSETIY